MNNKITIQHLQFSYQLNKPLIKCDNMQFDAGNIYMLIGKNGSGKSTFLKLLLGLLKPDTGVIQGLDNHIISYVPDDNGLYDTMSLIENIYFRLALYKIDPKEKQNEINELLYRYRLIEHKDILIRKFSLGMKKKAGLLCAMLVKPSLLVLDEPTGGLDLDSQKELSILLKEFLNKDNMIICTSHDEIFLESLPHKKIKFPLETSYDLYD